jgi:hypothetical protein
VPLSIYNLSPIELGGFEARKGFAFQDHVAAGFCLDMLENGTLMEVWCETLDDITLIFHLTDGVCVEFVQVKGTELDQLWTVAKVCEREKKENGVSKCILEKSLAQDRCRERCRFRMVTARPIKNELKVLGLPYDAPDRINGKIAFDALHELLNPKVGEFRSANGHDFTFWTANLYWDQRHDETSVHNANLLKLNSILNTKGLNLAPDQNNELYTKLLKKVWDASRADPRIAPAWKRIKRADFDDWLTRAANEIGMPSVGTTSKLERKMTVAGLARDVIDTAIDQVRRYRDEQLRPKYLALDDQRMIQGEVQATLQVLKSQLDNGDLPDDGVRFHGLCLEGLNRLRCELPLSPKPPVAFLQGCMYSITSRCLHRFRRIIV